MSAMPAVPGTPFEYRVTLYGRTNGYTDLCPTCSSGVAQTAIQSLITEPWDDVEAGIAYIRHAYERELHFCRSDHTEWPDA